MFNYSSVPTLLPVVGLAGLLAACTGSPHAGRRLQPAVPAAEMKLELVVPDEPLGLDSHSRIDARLTNASSQSVTVVLPGDGSEAGWRTPMISWSVVRTGPEAPSSENSSEKPVARCGNINPLRADEVVTLAPGESVSLGDWLGAPEFPSPGTYRVVLTYENDPKREWSGIPLGEHDPDAMARVRASTPVDVRSQEATVSVVE